MLPALNLPTRPPALSTPSSKDQRSLSPKAPARSRRGDRYGRELGGLEAPSFYQDLREYTNSTQIEAEAVVRNPYFVEMLGRPAPEYVLSASPGGVFFKHLDPYRPVGQLARSLAKRQELKGGNHNKFNPFRAGHRTHKRTGRRALTGACVARRAGTRTSSTTPTWPESSRR